MALRGAFGESIQQPAWKTIPSWYLVVQEDKAINPDLERFYAKRMGAKTTETRGGGGEVAPEGDRQLSEEINHLRRRFLGTAGMALAAAQLVAIDSANAQSGKTNPGMNTTFDLLKKIDAGVLNVGYAEAGSVGAPVVVLLHGWPYDIHSYWRLGLAEGESKYDELEKRLAEAPVK